MRVEFLAQGHKHFVCSVIDIRIIRTVDITCFIIHKTLKAILYSYLISKKMNEHITDS